MPRDGAGLLWLAPPLHELGDLAGPQITSLLSPISVLPRPRKRTVNRAGAGNNSEHFGSRGKRHSLLRQTAQTSDFVTMRKQECLRGKHGTYSGISQETLQLPGVLVVPGVRTVAMIMTIEIFCPFIVSFLFSFLHLLSIYCKT